MKRLFSLLLCCSLITSMTAHAIAAADNGIFDGYQEVVQSEFYQNGVSVASAFDAKRIVHNNGARIESDYFAEGEDQGNHLVAVTYIPKDGQIVETAHFTNVDELSETYFVNMIADYEEYVATMDVPATVSDDVTIKHYQWTFPDPDTDETLASLTTAVTCDRKSSNSTINGVACSVWDVTTFSQLENGAAARLNNQYTRLSVDLPNQKLIAYGPTESTSGGDISVGLDGAGVPNISYTFNIDGFSVENLSSMSNNYGRWKFVDWVGNESEFTTKPGIRATNSNGNFVVELSHTVDVNRWVGGTENQTTGVIRIYLHDR